LRSPAGQYENGNDKDLKKYDNAEKYRKDKEGGGYVE
jgi:hypothetical protein